MEQGVLRGRAVQVEPMKNMLKPNRLELSAGNQNMMNRFKQVLSNSTCAATMGAT
jgi:hypothetical protein